MQSLASRPAKWVINIALVIVIVASFFTRANWFNDIGFFVIGVGLASVYERYSQGMYYRGKHRRD